MKKKAIPPFTLTAGQSGRLLFNFTLPEGADTPALRGALMVQGQRVDMENTQADMLTIPSLPAGVYLTEVRAAGVCVLYGHVEVLPSPLFGEEGLATYRVDVDNTAEVLQVNIAMQGERGPQGEPGPQGEKGEQGEPGEDFTYEDLTPEQKAELIAPLGYAEVEVAPEGTTEEDYNAYGFGFVMPRTGRIKGLTLECRDSGTATPENTPVWLKVWRGTTLIARSENSQQHAVDAVLGYSFAEPFEVAEGEEIKVSFHAEEGLAETGYYMGRQCCLRVVDKDPAAPGGMLGDQGGYGSASDATQRSWVAKHTWHMHVGVFAPAEHVEDSTVHITAEEHAGLAELLAHKDELLALLA